jgi:predicted RNase H-like HicB family nuclease
VTSRTRQRNRQRAQQRQRPSPEQQRVGSSVELPYPVTLVQDAGGEGGDWVATVDALPGCTARGDTPPEALDAVSDAMTEWLQAAAREGRDAPDPKSLQSHSGRLLLRMPQTLHAELSRVAERESVSLNQFITDVLAGALGWRVPARLGRIATRPVQAGDPGANGDGEGEPIGEGLQPGQPQKRSARFVTAALVVNFVVVAVAAIVAIVVLIAAWL